MRDIRIRGEFMDITLSQKIKGCKIISGFPGFGLVGTIATEFLIDHLKCKKIGHYYFEDLPSTIAIHGGKLISPVGIFYDKEHNIVVIHSISAAAGIEWKAAELVLEVANKLQAKEIISVEGVGSADPTRSRTFYYASDDKASEDLKKAGYAPLDEGIIVGVTSALLLKSEFPITCIFAETHTQLPDSKAAANIINALDKYIGLKVETKPLLDQARKFEEKVRSILEQGKAAEEQRDKKALSYVG
jgi:uncharacterized protein